MKEKLILLCMLTGSIFAGACTDAAKPIAVTNTPPRPAATEKHTDEGHDAPRITLADAKKAYDAGTAVIIDVRDVNAFRQEHVKGSLNITLADLATSTDKIPKGKKIIAYCS